MRPSKDDWPLVNDVLQGRCHIPLMIQSYVSSWSLDRHWLLKEYRLESFAKNVVRMYMFIRIESKIRQNSLAMGSWAI